MLAYASTRYAIVDARLAEKVFAGLFRDEAELFKLEVGALDLAFVDGEFLRERRG